MPLDFDCTCTSFPFQNRAPPGSNVIVNFMGGAQDPEVALLSPQQIVEQVKHVK